MLRKFKINVDGKEYLVEMEEIGGLPQAAPAPAPVTPAAPVASVAPAPAETPAAPAPSAAPTPAGADALTAPMPGTILKVFVNVGDQVEVNQPLMILEAMKMENEIVATVAGTVQGIHVSTGQTVNPGDALVTVN